MKRIIYGIVLTLALVAGGRVGAMAQEASQAPVRIVGAAFEPAEVLIGDHFGLNIEVEAEDGSEVAFPTITEEFADGCIELLEESPTDTVEHKEGVWRLRKQYRLTSFEPAEYRLDSLGVLYRSGNSIDTAFVNGILQVKVDWMPVDTAQKTIYDIKQPMKTPLVVEEFGGYTALGVLIVAALASAIYLIISRSHKAKGVEKGEDLPQEAPHIVAIRHLEMLSNQKLWQNGKYKAYWSRLTEILRAYLDARYGVGAMEMTTDEIVAALATLNIEPKQLADMKNLLAESDLVKFAKHTPEAETNEEAYYKTYYFVENTKELAAESDSLANEVPEVIVPQKEKEEEGSHE